jgi:hypothetical protein
MDNCTEGFVRVNVELLRSVLALCADATPPVKFYLDYPQYTGEGWYEKAEKHWYKDRDFLMTEIEELL